MKNNLVDDILNKISNEDIVSKLNIETKRIGSKIFIHCPNHADTNPSLMLNGNNTFHCFSCGFHTNIIGYLSRRNNIAKGEAIKQIADMFNIDYSQYQKPLLDFTKDDYTKGFENTEDIFKELNNEIELSKWLKTRNLDKKYFEGYCVSDKDLISKIHSRRINSQTIHQLESTGVIYETSFSEKNELKFKSLYNPFIATNSILFPIRDKDSYVLGYAARAIDNNYLPKYKYTKGFKAAESLYRIDKVWENLKKFKLEQEQENNPKKYKAFKLYIVEGLFDALRMESMGMNALAVLGSSIKGDLLDRIRTTSQIHQVKEICKECGKYGIEIVLFLDNDKAGRRGTTSTIKKLKDLFLDRELNNITIKVKTVFTRNLTEKDPDEILQKIDISTLEICTLAEFYISNALIEDEKQGLATIIADFSSNKYNDYQRNRIFQEMLNAFGVEDTNDESLYNSLFSDSIDSVKFIGETIKKKFESEYLNYGIIKSENNEIYEIDKIISIAKATYSNLEIEFPVDLFAWDRLEKGSNILASILFEKFDIKTPYKSYTSIYEAKVNGNIPRTKTIASHEDIIVETYILYHLFKRGEFDNGKIPFIAYDNQERLDINKIKTFTLNKFKPNTGGYGNAVSFAYQINLACIRDEDISLGLFRKFYDCWEDFIEYITKRVNKSPKNKTLSLKRLDIRKFYDSLNFESATHVLKKSAEDLHDSNSVLRELFTCKDENKDEYELNKKLLDWIRLRSFHDEKTKGLPQGPSLSSWIANTALFEIDKILSNAVEEINDEYRFNNKDSQDIVVATYARYVDDIIVIAPTDKETQYLQSLIEIELSKLNLSISVEKTKSESNLSKSSILTKLISNRHFGNPYSDINIEINENIDDLYNEAYDTLLDRGRILRSFYNQFLYSKETKIEDLKKSIELLSAKTSESKPNDFISCAARLWYVVARKLKDNETLNAAEEYINLYRKYFPKDIIEESENLNFNEQIIKTKDFFTSIIGLKKFLFQRYDRSLNLDISSREEIEKSRNLLETKLNIDSIESLSNEFLYIKNIDDKIKEYKNISVLSLLPKISHKKEDLEKLKIGITKEYFNFFLKLDIDYAQTDSRATSDQIEAFHFIIEKLSKNSKFIGAWYENINSNELKLLLPHDNEVQATSNEKINAIKVLAKCFNSNTHLSALEERSTLCNFVFCKGRDIQKLEIFPSLETSKENSLFAFIKENDSEKIKVISEEEESSAKVIELGDNTIEFLFDSFREDKNLSIYESEISLTSNDFARHEFFNNEASLNDLKNLLFLLNKFRDREFLSKMENYIFSAKHLLKGANQLLLLLQPEKEVNTPYYVSEFGNPKREKEGKDSFQKLGYLISSIINKESVKPTDLLEKAQKHSLLQNSKNWATDSFLTYIAYIFQNIRLNTILHKNIFDRIISTIEKLIKGENKISQELFSEVLNFRVFMLIIHNTNKFIDSKKIYSAGSISETISYIAKNFIRHNEPFGRYITKKPTNNITGRINVDCWINISELFDSDIINQSYLMLAINAYIKSTTLDLISVHTKVYDNDVEAHIENQIIELDIDINDCFLENTENATINDILNSKGNDKLSLLGWYLLFRASVLCYSRRRGKDIENPASKKLKFKEGIFTKLTKIYKDNFNKNEDITKKLEEYKDIKIKDIKDLDIALKKYCNIKLETIKTTTTPLVRNGQKATLNIKGSSYEKPAYLCNQIAKIGNESNIYTTTDDHDKVIYTISISSVDSNIASIGYTNKILGALLLQSDTEISIAKEKTEEIKIENKKSPLLDNELKEPTPQVADSEKTKETDSDKEINFISIEQFEKLQKNNWKARKTRKLNGVRVALLQFDGGNTYNHPLYECIEESDNDKEKPKLCEHTKGEFLESKTEARRRNILEKAINACIDFGVEILLLPEYSVRPDTLDFVKNLLNETGSENLYIWAGTYRNTYLQKTKKDSLYTAVINDEWKKSHSATLEILNKNFERGVFFRNKKYPAISENENIFPYEKTIEPIMRNSEFINYLNNKKLPYKGIMSHSYIFELICSEIFFITSPANINPLVSKAIELISKFRPIDNEEFKKRHDLFIKDLTNLGDYITTGKTLKQSLSEKSTSSEYNPQDYLPRRSILLLPCMTSRPIDHHYAANVNNLASGITSVFCNSTMYKNGKSCFLGNAISQVKDKFDPYQLKDTPYSGIAPGIFYNDEKLGGPLGKTEEALVIADIDPTLTNGGRPRPQTLGDSLKLIAHLPILEIPSEEGNECNILSELNKIVDPETSHALSKKDKHETLESLSKLFKDSKWMEERARYWNNYSTPYPNNIYKASPFVDFLILKKSNEEKVQIEVPPFIEEC